MESFIFCVSERGNPSLNIREGACYQGSLMLSLGTLRSEHENGNMNGQETETSFLIAVFRFRREKITLLWRESENDTCKQTS